MSGLLPSKLGPRHISLTNKSVIAESPSKARLAIDLTDVSESFFTLELLDVVS